MQKIQGVVYRCAGFLRAYCQATVFLKEKGSSPFIFLGGGNLYLLEPMAAAVGFEMGHIGQREVARVTTKIPIW